MPMNPKSNVPQSSQFKNMEEKIDVEEHDIESLRNKDESPAKEQEECKEERVRTSGSISSVLAENPGFKK